MTTNEYNHLAPSLIPVTLFRDAAVRDKIIPPANAFFQPQDGYLNRCWYKAGAKSCEARKTPQAHSYVTGYLNESDEGGGAWEGWAVRCRRCGLMAPYSEFNGDGYYEEVAMAMVACPAADKWYAGTKGGEPRVWFLTEDDPELSVIMGDPIEWRQ